MEHGKTSMLNQIYYGLNSSEYIEQLKGITIGYFKQEVALLDLNLTTYEYVKKELGLNVLEEELKKLNSNLDTLENIEKYSDIHEEYINKGGYEFDYKLEKILKGFNIDEFVDTKLEFLSGGQRAKVLLTTSIINEPDLLFLDEPTNNLDIKSLNWLENYLNRLDSSMLIVSHDRKFLDNITNKTIELDKNTKNIIEYNGNYSEYKKHKDLEHKKQQEKYLESLDEKKRLKDNLLKKQAWENKGGKQSVKDNDKYTRGYERDRSKSLVSNNKSIDKKINELEKIKKPNINKELHINLNVEKNKNNKDIMLEDLIVGYDSGFKSNPINGFIKFKDRIHIVGDNGSRKKYIFKNSCKY